MSNPSEYWSIEDAALNLANALHRTRELQAQKDDYEWGYPPSLTDELARTAETVRDAVRYLVSPEALG